MRVSDIVLPSTARARFGHILDVIQDQELPEPCGWTVLILQYMKPEKVGSLFIPNQEDKYQGRTGLVLALGPEAWADRTKYPFGPWANVGDIVVWGKLESGLSRFSFGEYAGDRVDIVAMPDDRILARNVDPLKVGQ